MGRESLARWLPGAASRPAMALPIDSVELSGGPTLETFASHGERAGIYSNWEVVVYNGCNACNAHCTRLLTADCCWLTANTTGWFACNCRDCGRRISVCICLPTSIRTDSQVPCPRRSADVGMPLLVATCHGHAGRPVWPWHPRLARKRWHRRWFCCTRPRTGVGRRHVGTFRLHRSSQASLAIGVRCRT